jgi:hypothetical protein
MVQTINETCLYGVLTDNSGYVVENVIGFGAGGDINPGRGPKINETSSGSIVDLKIRGGKIGISRQKTRR